jgi:hypothetical protein
MKRIAAFVYGVACYGAFLAVFLYAIGFLGNFAVTKSIDSGPQGSIAAALAIDAILLTLFRAAAQHHGPALVQTRLDALRPGAGRA